MNGFQLVLYSKKLQVFHDLRDLAFLQQLS